MKSSTTIFHFPFSIFHSTQSAFTLVELLVVVGMIAILMGAMTSAVQSARERARVQKATSDVKVITQAILAYENWNGDELPTMGSRGKAAGGVDATSSSLGFLLGKGSAKGVGGRGGESGGELPVLLMGQLQGNGALRDPWGTPYKVTVAEATAAIQLKTVTGSLWAGFWLPNFYREWGE
jgi:prepilin-type N-terminal cleavage/methylation domain-containing protein